MASSLDKITAAIQKVPKKTRYIVFGALIGLIGVAFIYFFYIPMKTQIKALTKNIADLQVTIQANDAKIRKLDELRAEVKGMEQTLRLLTEQLPPGSEVSGLLKQIQNLISQSGLTLKLWRPEKRKPHSSGLYEEIPINLEFTGGYHDTGIFFDRVSKMTRIVHTLNLKMSGANMNKAGGMDIKVNCTAMTFAATERKPDAVSEKTTPVKVSR